eukprot:3409550-Amphidinium_carterae.1
MLASSVRHLRGQRFSCINTPTRQCTLPCKREEGTIPLLDCYERLILRMRVSRATMAINHEPGLRR